jgi:hypothetical protein
VRRIDAWRSLSTLTFTAFNPTHDARDAVGFSTPDGFSTNDVFTRLTPGYVLSATIAIRGLARHFRISSRCRSR